MRHVFSAAVVAGVVASAFVAYAQQPPAPAPAPNSSSAPQIQVTASPELALQIALDRAGFSPGEIDGKGGNNTQRALRAFQEANGLTPTGKPDRSTIDRLGEGYQTPLSTYAITADDVAGPFVDNIPADIVKQADLPALGYTSIRELLGERFHTSPALLERLNPNAQWTQGELITVPNVEPFFTVSSPTSKRGNPTMTPHANVQAGAQPPAAMAPASDAARANNVPANGNAATKANAARGDARSATKMARNDLVITVTDKTKTLSVTDSSGKIVFHAPVTVGSEKDPLPVGEWKVNGVQYNPPFNYNPDLFWDADPSHSKAKIAAGPNNPVGAVWIDLSKEHYGIHGTPEPSRVGYTASHGCIRLTNWDAVRLAALVAPGTKVILR